MVQKTRNERHFQRSKKRKKQRRKRTQTGELVGGAGCVGGQEKEWMGCFLDDLRPFGINADQWTTAAQDEGEWRRTAEQGAEHFMAKWIAAEQAGFTYLQSMDFQRESQSKHHLYCKQEKPAHCHGSLLLRLGTHQQIQNRTRDAHKISPHGTMTKRTPAMN